ncbi:MAG: hypothetical protein HYW49_13650 [Deltaproteobacteria bacterium]|nr:hypothetical protein [Deltaproteobacteria bacterium]
MLTAIATPAAWAQHQQAPPQHAPSQPGFPQSRYEKVLIKTGRKAGIAGSTRLDGAHPDGTHLDGTHLEWDAMPLVRRWLVVIALDDEMNEILDVGTSDASSYTAPALPPGLYYFYAEGLSAERVIGRTDVTEFRIAGDSGDTRKKKALPAPELLEPADGAFFPVEPKARLSWKPVAGARSYRVQIWDKDEVRDRVRKQRLPVARWITETREPWLEFHDVPYSSYLYLQPAEYRWDVAAIDATTDELGQQSSRSFVVTRQYYLRSKQVLVRLNAAFSASAKYGSHSATGNQSQQLSASSSGIAAEAQWWYARQWGLGFDADLLTVGLGGAGNSAAFSLGADFNHRVHLSKDAAGWTLVFGAGLGLQQLPQIDRASSPSQVSSPQALGPRLGLRLIKRFESPWEAELRLASLVPAYTFATPTGADVTKAPLNAAATVALRYHTNPNTAWMVGYSGGVRRVLYVPSGSRAQSGASLAAGYAQLGIQVEY